MLMQFKILLHALKRNSLLQLFFYLSNLDAVRFIEYSKTVEYLDKEDTQIILDLGTGHSVLPSFPGNRFLDFMHACRNCNCSHGVEKESSNQNFL